MEEVCEGVVQRVTNPSDRNGRMLRIRTTGGEERNLFLGYDHYPFDEDSEMPNARRIPKEGEAVRVMGIDGDAVIKMKIL